jgi:hypothetical protein
MLIEIETLQENSLILIEEIENGLHPIATIRMVEYLIDVAERKKAQIIFTTHSNDSLLPLPNKAIWSATNNKFFQGKLDVKSLRAITGQVDAKLAIFVEDDFSKSWIETVISNSLEILPDEIEIHAMKGDGTAVSVNKYHNVNPTIKCKSICFIDGDSEQIENEIDKVFRLPGQSPESFIYDKILDKIDVLAGELAVALHKPYESHELIKNKVKSIRLTNRDSHLLFSQVGKEIGFISEIVVRSAFLHIWVRTYLNESDKLILIIKNELK